MDGLQTPSIPSDATLDDKDGNGEYDAPFNHEHLFSIGATWEINERWLAGFRWKYATGRPRDDFTIHDDVLAGVGGPLRFSQEFISNGTLRWDDFHQLNVRVDYRRPLGPVDFIAIRGMNHHTGCQVVARAQHVGVPYRAVPELRDVSVGDEAGRAVRVHAVAPDLDAFQPPPRIVVVAHPQPADAGGPPRDRSDFHL